MMRRFVILLVLLLSLPATGAVFAADPTVARGVFTSEVSDREPVDDLRAIDTKTGKLNFFTELLNFEGTTVIHRWSYNGQVMAAIPFKVNGPRWRVYSSKIVIPEWTGTWEVSVVGAGGATVYTKTIEVAPGANVTTAPPATILDELPAGISRAQFTSAITDREPADELSIATTQTTELFFFSELTGMEGETITHRWVYNDQVVAEIPLQIGSASWRTYSSKTLIPAWVGTWRVDILDGRGDIMISKLLERTAQ